MTPLSLEEVFKVFAQVKVHLRLLTLHLVLKNALMGLVYGFFALFPGGKKCACRRESECGGVREVSSWTLAAYGETIGADEWVKIYEGGKTHYWNRRSNETFWNPPEGIQVVWIGEKSADGGIASSWLMALGVRAWHPLTPSRVPLLAGLFGVFVLPETYSLDSSGSVLCALLGLTANTVHVSVFGGFWLSGKVDLGS